jgi:hypothetical protein
MLFNYIFDNNIIFCSILGNISGFMSMFLFSLSLTLFYLDDFKLSDKKFIKLIQIFSFVFISIFILYCMYDVSNIYLSDIVSYATENKDDKDINLHGHVKVDKEAAKVIGQGLQTIGSNLGLGATIAGVSTAVGKAIAKSSLPPIQKAGIVLGAGVLGGLTHSKLSESNMNRILKENIENNNLTKFNSSSNINDSNVSKFIDDNITSSPLENLLSNFELTNYVCISMLILLAIQIIFKLHFKDNIKLNLTWILGDKFNNNLEFYVNKIIALNKKMSTFYIWLILLSLIVGLYSSIYVINDIQNNLEDYITVHNSIKGK